MVRENRAAGFKGKGETLILKHALDSAMKQNFSMFLHARKIYSKVNVVSFFETIYHAM